MASKKLHDLTQEGYDNYRDELNELITIKRPENVKALKEAREQGDLSENADYDAARNEQAKIESRIKELEYILKNSKIIKTDSNLDVVSSGKTVHLDIKFESGKTKSVEYKIVGSLEANPLNNRISTESPIGKAILNKGVGDLIHTRSETGKNLEIKIKKIDI